ncbi:hypothetical protein [Flavobacterium sp. CAU 1735]|uniref:hypothetical protein n=1 Tax=Flavobacterium sp. CAU 1735 TaxID=3140361 RepID=UPI003260BC42
MRIFRKIIYDSQYINGTGEIKFFTGNDENDESVTEMTEDQIIKWLFANSSFRSIFYETLFEDYKTVKYFTEVTHPFTTKNKKPGDIDVLLVDPSHPEKTIVFECKRVKCISQDDQTTKINNLQKIKKGVVQAEFYKNLGFYQSYLMIILLDDGRKYNTPNILFRTTDMPNDYYNIPTDEGLSEEIGIIFVKVEQFSGRHIDKSGGFGICIERYSNEFEQSAELTNKVVDFVNNSNYST